MLNAKYPTYAYVANQLKIGKVTTIGLVQFYLSQIKKHEHLNAFLEVFEQDALTKAKEIDIKIQNGTAGKLAGAIIAVKDNICFKDHRVSASSKILEGFESVYSATVVEKLLAEDAIIIGRCNCDEFAMGASNENSAFGPVKNYDDPLKVPGGSSGGSAVAVQAEMCLMALGSDTGGSIRQPASFTGTIGFKPSYGAVSRYGLLAYASSFDQIGPITRSVDDATLVMSIIAGNDPKDATSIQHDLGFKNAGVSAKPLKLRYIQETMEGNGIDPAVKEAFKKIINELKNAGHDVAPVSFPYLDYMVPCYYTLTTAEASSNLSRYSGMLYGYRSKESKDIDSTFKKSRSEGFGEEVKRRIMTGTFVLSADYYDAYYTKAQKVRRIIRDESAKLLVEADFLLSPTTPSTAFDIGGSHSKDPLQMYLADIFTVHASLAGLPAISVPIGRDVAGMSIGLQIVGKYGDDVAVLDFAKSFE